MPITMIVGSDVSSGIFQKRFCLKNQNGNVGLPVGALVDLISLVNEGQFCSVISPLQEIPSANFIQQPSKLRRRFHG
jgi:hypothetical protein